MPTHLKPEPHSGGVSVSPDPSPEVLEGVRRRKRIQRLQEAQNKVSKEPEEIPDSALAKPGKWYIRHVYDGDELYYLEGLTPALIRNRLNIGIPTMGALIRWMVRNPNKTTPSAEIRNSPFPLWRW